MEVHPKLIACPESQSIGGKSLTQSQAKFDMLPPDVLGIIFKQFFHLKGIRTLKNLSRTCKLFDAVVKVRTESALQMIAHEIETNHQWILNDLFSFLTDEEKENFIKNRIVPERVHQTMDGCYIDGEREFELFDILGDPNHQAFRSHLYYIHAVAKLRTMRAAMLLKERCKEDWIAALARDIFFTKILNIDHNCDLSTEIIKEENHYKLMGHVTRIKGDNVLPLSERLPMIRCLIAAGIEPNTQITEDEKDWLECVFFDEPEPVDNEQSSFVDGANNKQFFSDETRYRVFVTLLENGWDINRLRSSDGLLLLDFLLKPESQSHAGVNSVINFLKRHGAKRACELYDTL